MKELLIGKIYHYPDIEKSAFRIIERIGEEVFAVKLDAGETAVPYALKIQDIKIEMEEEILEELEDPFEEFIIEDDLSQKQKDERDQKWKVIHSIWSDPIERELFLERSERRKGYALVAGKLDISLIQAQRLMTRFWQRGMTPNALLPQYHKRANGEHLKGRKAGRKGSGELAPDQKVREQFRKAYEKIYLKQKKSLKETYDYLIGHYYSKEPSKYCPTYNQFYYWVRQKREPESEILKREGKREYNNNFRVAHGTSREQVEGPGSRFEIDATHLNIQVVSKFDPDKVIGTPTLFSIVDVYSRMVVGLYVTMERESSRVAAQALLGCVEDKVKLCARYGIEITQEEWPAHYLPERLLYDNGPAKSSTKLEMFKKTYGVDFEYSPPYSPISKPNVERRHQEYKRYIEGHLPGAMRREGRKRGDRDSRLDAALTLEELTQIILRLTLEFNKTDIEDFELSPQMILEDVSPNPLEMWDWGVNHGLGGLKHVSKIEKFRLSLMPHVERVVRKTGIRFKKRDYAAGDEQTQRVLNNHQGLRVELCYNPIDISEAYLYLNGEYYPLVMRVQDRNVYTNVSEIEMDFINDYAQSSKHESRVESARSWDSANKDIKELSADAVKSRPRRTRSECQQSKENRSEYINLSREEEVNQQKENSPEEMPEQNYSSFEMRRAAFIRMKQQENQDNE